MEEAKTSFEGTGIQISKDGERHLGAVIGNKAFKEQYCKKIVKKWSEELTLLTRIAVTNPQAAYTCYISGYQHRFSYYLRTIPQLEEYLQPIENILRHQFIPAITGGKTINDNERNLLSLPPQMGGLGLKNICEIAPIEHENFKQFTVKLQNQILGITEEEEGKSISTIKNEKNQRNKEKLEQVRTSLNEDQKRKNDSNCLAGSSNWLTNLPIKELGYDLNKEQFQDALRIRYNWVLPRLPTECACGNSFDVSHALSCNKGGYL